MKILILQSKSALGFNSGELRVAKNEFHLLNSYGHDVELIEYGPGKLTNIFTKFFFMINSLWSFWSYFEIKKIVKRKKPDIIHFHGLFPFLTLSSLIAAKNSRSKVVITLHNVSLICLEGAFYRNAEGLYSVNIEKMTDAINSLSELILTLQGNGDYDGVNELVVKSGVIKADLAEDLARIEAAKIPVDITFKQGKKVLGL